MYRFIFVIFLLPLVSLNGFTQLTPYEQNGNNYTATYEECINFYKSLDSQFHTLKLIEQGLTDAGIPLHVALISNEKNFTPSAWNNKVVILINNGIHPGEPDGIDASMMLTRDILKGKISLPNQVVLAVIPSYNIDGMLERSPFRRVDQNGPLEKGTRGNGQYLDLNRDFIKCDSRNARNFAQLFHWLNPDILIDNHVSDGADYTYTMTLLSTQHQKLGGPMGNYLHQTFEPFLYESMKQKGNEMIPYVSVWGWDAKQGWNGFFDSPRYASGYAALFNCFGFVPECHMLKAYPDRVNATYELMRSFIDFATTHHTEIKTQRKLQERHMLTASEYPLVWKHQKDSMSWIPFEGYTYEEVPSGLSDTRIKVYNQTKPYDTIIPYRNYYSPIQSVTIPEAYILAQAWWKVIELLKLNKVEMKPLVHDTLIEVGVYTINSFNSGSTPYEGHHANKDFEIKKTMQYIQCRKGDLYIPTKQKARRFILETLEPYGMDSYLVWNFFDPILGQKEGYSDYAFLPIARKYLKENPELKLRFDNKLMSDSSFAKDIHAQLEFIHKNSPYFEERLNRYPVYRIEPKNENRTIPQSGPKVTPIINKRDE